jgi:hypothetical protein
MSFRSVLLQAAPLHLTMERLHMPKSPKPTTPVVPELLSIAATCAGYSLNKTLVYALAREGQIDVRKVGKRSLVVRSSLDKWVAGLPRAPFAAVTGGA